MSGGVCARCGPLSKSESTAPASSTWPDVTCRQARDAQAPVPWHPDIRSASSPRTVGNLVFIAKCLTICQMFNVDGDGSVPRVSEDGDEMV